MPDQAALASMTPAQRKAAEDAIRSRQAGGSYSGADFQAMIEQLRDRKGMTYADAYCQVLKTPQGQAAHKAFLRARNPHLAD